MSKVKIAARLRPFIETETVDDSVIAFADSFSVTNPRDVSQRFKYALPSCYGQEATQESIFKRDVAPLLGDVFAGLTVTIFAYGVTSSGKTHTMQGSKSDPGIIPRVISALFQMKQTMQHLTISFAMSYMEIYKDECFDLLVPRAAKLPVRENDEGKVFVANLTSSSLESSDQFDRIFTTACKARSTGATNLNHASSRSHAILGIEVLCIDLQSNKTLTGRINLVDLAGSENNKLTGNDPSRMAESSAINKSLSVLGQVVHALNQGLSRIPYRDSKLTRILQDALGGGSLGLLICNLAPGSKFRQDTLNTLNFASRTKEIENRPVVNEKDNGPPPKMHFAALKPNRVARPSFKPVAVQAPRPSLQPQTLAPQTLAPQNLAVRRPSLQPPVAASLRPPLQPQVGMNGSSSLPARKISVGQDGLTAEKLDSLISKAVEAEVAKRMEAVLKAQEKTHQEREKELELLRQQQLPPPPAYTLPVATEGLRLSEEELQRRLAQLDKLERLHSLTRRTSREDEDEDQYLARVLTPVRKKSLVRAYLARARQLEDDEELDNSLLLYQRAERLAPDNQKLKNRISGLMKRIAEGPSGMKRKSKGKRAISERDDDETHISETANYFDLTTPIKKKKKTDTHLDGRPKKPRVFSEVRNEEMEVEMSLMTPKNKKPKAGGIGKKAITRKKDDDEWAPGHS